MLTTTRNAIEAIAASDPTIDRARLVEGLQVIVGELEAVKDIGEDRAISRIEAAKLLGVHPNTVGLYARRGIIRPIRLGAKRLRSIGYSLQSIREAIARR